MICPKCKTENLDNANYCISCGTPLKDAGGGNEIEKGKKNGLSTLGIVGVCLPALFILLIIGVSVFVRTKKTVEIAKDAMQENTEIIEEIKDKIEDASLSSEPSSDEAESTDFIKRAETPGLITGETDESDIRGIKPCVEPYTIEEDFSNVMDSENLLWRDEDFLNKLRTNGFVVCDGNGREFYEGYEINRYMQTPSFITVDSLMHTYHVYFSYLQRSVEKQYLKDELSALVSDMLKESYSQYKALKGTDFEQAALRNTAFFAVPCVLLDENAAFPSEVKDIVKNEYEKIMAAEGIESCEITGDYEDYSQYKVRGYYEGDADLEKYFRAMMWCGRIQFDQDNEDMDRSALLMTLALSDSNYDKWESIYSVTSFFAGASDDLGVCDYSPLIEDVYGKEVSVETVGKAADKWKEFHNLTGKFEGPRINSAVIEDTGDQSNEILGYRFMGQRFTVDAAIMQKLIYSSVGEYDDGDKRMLPDVLDVPAALGSQTAYDILDEQGDTAYKNYNENLEKLKEEFADDSSSVWSASLYGGWLNTLRPLLEEKGEGYPMFMQSDEWKKKDIETFAGSYTELKHDTILYSKQVMAEMGGGDEEKDFRGYVEPEPLVFSRFETLSKNTKEGLEKYGYLTKNDSENLDRLAELAGKLKTIAVKELTGVEVTTEEYDLIECYGGEIEHFWLDAMKGITGEEYPTTEDFPAALVVDVATDPNGSVLEMATGDPACIYVVVPVDGTLRVAEGSVYSFYQFEQPLSERLTDSDWRKMLGIEIESYDDPFPNLKDIEHPEWANSYRYFYEY